MLLFLKRIFLVLAAAALFTQTTFGFALLGPRDTWQTSALGYDPQGDLGDIGGPKNLGEEWRWVLPTITYAYDPSFINFFGTNGIAAVDDAVFLFNKEMTNLSQLTDAQLRAKPLDTKRIHATAQALGVLDLKSYAMGLLAEQLGLAGAVRWTWALRDRQVFNNNITNYLVIQRNFDPFTLKPTRYVNGHKWSYFIGTFPTGVGGGTYEDAAEIPIDQAADGPFIGSAVSAVVGEDLLSTGLRAGEYYSALSQDDIGGLRYMYQRFNYNAEVLPVSTRDIATFAPSIRAVDTNALTFIPGIDAFTFFTNITTLNPTNLSSVFSNLVVLSTNISLTNIVTTNFVVTNIAAGGLFTNQALPMLITNFDLFLFSEDSRTNPPNAMLALWPGLIITKTNSSFVSQIDEILYLTNAPFSSPGDPLILKTNFVTNIVVNYSYQYANVITNYASAVTDLELRYIHRATWSTPQDPFLETNITTLRTNLPSGGFFILDRSTNANLIGYSFSDTNGVPLLRSTNIFDSTISFTILTNVFDPFDIRRWDVVNEFTNVVYAALPVFLNGTAGQFTVPVVTTNLTVRYDYVFDTNNILFFPPSNGNTNAILQTITFTNGGPVRITEEPAFTGTPGGTILILDTNNFVLAGPRIETFGFVTNVITAFTNAVTGEFITQQLIYQTNQILFAVYPVVFIQSTSPTLRAGVDTLQFKKIPYLDFLTQSTAISTNTYTIRSFTNGVEYVQQVRRIAGPDIIFSTVDATTSGAFPVAVTRFINWQQGATTIVAGATTDRGPGQVAGGSTISFSTLSPSWVVQTPGALTEETSFLFLQWGSFDSKTLLPRLYPEDITGQLKTLEDIVLRRNPAQ